MGFVIIGLGSMGKRRMRLLSSIDDRYLIYGIDAREDRRIEAEGVAKEHGVNLRTFESIDKLKKYLADDNNRDIIAAALVCTSPLSHSSIIRECLNSGWNVFSEINLVDDGYDEIIRIADENNLTLYLSSTPMFKEEIRYITNEIDNQTKRVNYIFHVGQYLPDWHPWESYKDFFIGNKKTNGCREILAIELPWIIKCFGEIEDINVMSGRSTTLDIEFNDNVSLLVRHTNGNIGTIVVDVVCRKAVRSLEIFGEDIYLIWNGAFDGLKIRDTSSGEMNAIGLYRDVEHQSGYNRLIIEDAYKEELRNFLSTLNGDTEAAYDFERDQYVLNLIDRIEGYNE